MNLSKNLKRFCSLILAFIMVLGVMPVGAMAAEDSIVVIAASDYQLSNSGTIMTNAMNQVKADYGTAYGVLMGGDYDAGNVNTTVTHIKNVDNTISGVFPEIASENRVYLQGNHENYAGLKPSSSNLLTTEHVRDTAYYGVYAINHDDFPWTMSSNPAPSESLVRATADALGDYLEAKIAEGYTKPIFVMSHLPLHATTRGDNKYASLIFDELEAAGEAGLNIIFLVGHNHSGGYDAYLGNGSFYLPVGSSLTVVKGSSGTYTDSSISFTYMNYGYLGKISGSACTHQTITAFEITGNQVTVKRYDESGLHQLKAAGAAVSGYNTDSSVIGTEGAVIELGEPEPVYTVTDGNVSVTSTGLTGLTVTKIQGTADGKHDAEVYGAYASYDIVPEGYEQGKTATVTITLDEEDGFDASKAVYMIDAEKGTEQKLTITNGAVTFTTSHFSTYSIAQKVTKTGSYELATSIEAGESYVIVANDHDVALMDNDGSLGSMGVTISGDTLTSEEELTEWTFSSASSGTITSGNGNKLGYSSSCWNLTGSGDCTFDIGTGNGNFSLRVIRASSGYNRYYFYYDGSDWAKNSSSSASYVRLYKLAEGGSTVEPEQPETPDVPDTPDVPEVGDDWIELPAGNVFQLDTDGIDNGAKYLIVAKSYDKALIAAASNGNATDVSISGNEATADADYGWTISASGNGYVLQKNGTYLGRSSSKLAAGNSSSVWTISSSGNGNYTITQSGSGSSWWGGSSNYYVRWSNSNGYFQASSSSTDPVRLYKYAGAGADIDAAYIRLSGETEQTYTIADAAALDTILSKVAIQTSNDGSTVNSETLAVTSDMVTWNPAFNGKAAGTYTGTVSFDGQNLGTITVTINAEHNFETITVDATCTEDGSITTKCTICGEETVEVIPATGHNYEVTVTAPTCTEDGYTTYTCACGDSYIDDEIAALGHNYDSVTTEATCTEDGSIVYTCVCGDTYADVIPALGHSYDSVTTEATCTEDGSIVYTCACGDTFTDVIPALGHKYEAVVTAPTCTEDGYTTYTCACGDSYVTDEVAALGHKYEAVVTAPTCTDNGFTTYTCACGDSYVADEVAALGHNYEAVTTEATCTKDGSIVHTCACGDSYTDVIPALGHDQESVITAPTCESDGYTTHTCRRCGDVTVDTIVPALGHELKVVTLDPTCTEDGSRTESCLRCGSTSSQVIPALGHQYETVVTAPTCTEGGYTTYTCACGDSYIADEVAALGHIYESVTNAATCGKEGSVVYTCTCGDTYTEILPALDHTYEAVVSAPTCTEDGYTTYTCACGDSYVADKVAALGHKYEAVVTAPTCTEDGYTTYTCACGDSYVADEVAALGHKYESVTTAPTCTEDGYTTYTCACGDSYVADEVAALGHKYETVVTAPTCTEDGYTTYTCACGDSHKSDYVKALGHSYSHADSNGYRVYTCSHCGHSYSEKLSFTYSQATALASGERFVITVKSGNKYYALSHRGNSISAVQIKVSNGTVTSEISEDLLWSYADQKLSYVSNGTTYYLYTYTSGWWWYTSTSLGISSDDAGTISFSSSKLKIDSRYLRYSGSKFSVSSSSSSVYLFQEK